MLVFTMEIFSRLIAWEIKAYTVLLNKFKELEQISSKSGGNFFVLDCFKNEPKERRLNKEFFH